MNRLIRMALVTLCFAAAQVHGMQLAGVELPQRIEVEGIEQPLLLNGAGVRKKFFVKIYVAGLYLPQPQHDAAVLLGSPPANRVAMHFVYSAVSRDKLDAAWRDGFRANLDEAAYVALQPRLQKFMDLFPAMRDGDRAWLDYLPQEGTRVSINGEARGMIPGADFNAALLSVWLGGQPVTAGLKNSLLGADN